MPKNQAAIVDNVFGSLKSADTNSIINEIRARRAAAANKETMTSPVAASQGINIFQMSN
jgi:hypothetical protein